ncbi:BspA family leucine-rich repeat surface protein [Lactobacillus kullabergensis]|uniref:BspA family leucine-rich repeat surface protein n=1 Tax=Lactobacillus kullabergensis TaxID=1218493 RepID=UPI002245950E|nr:BspA family leucine-rich repeat surface protein [Lactobacillus kullabergensis]MCX0291185.1 BspA family leucine-rich repeat surface protein [Lactobacillus kullabergensis]
MNSKFNLHGREKLILTIVATAVLGLIAMNPAVIKADTAVTKPLTTKREVINKHKNKYKEFYQNTNSLKNKNIGNNTNSYVANNTDVNPLESSATPSINSSSTLNTADQLQPSNVQSIKGAQNSSAGTISVKEDDPESIMIGDWDGLKVTLDIDARVCTISGGTITDPDQLIPYIPNTYGLAETLKFDGPLKIIGKANGIFSGLAYTTKIEGLENIDTSQVTNMSQMFSGCEKLKQLDLSSFDTRKVTNMYAMFQNCKSLTSLSLKNFDTTSVNEMTNMFNNCTNLSSLDLSSFNTSQVKRMFSMFGYCTSLSSLDLKNFDTAKVLEMTAMFSNCSNLKTLDISNFNTLSAKKSYMLAGASNLNTLILGPNCSLKNTALDRPGFWLNVGSGTMEHPEGSKHWTSKELMSKYTGAQDHDTYVRTNSAVIEHFLDESGKSIAPDNALTGNSGDPYSSSAKDINGYILKTSPANTKGTFSDQIQEVTYIYAKKPKQTGSHYIGEGVVTVHYQDENGQQLAPDRVLTGNVGDGYLTQEVKLTGYNLTQRPNNATGFYTDRPQSVTYIYSQNVTNRTAVRKTVFHNSYLYDQNGSRKTGKYFMGKTIWTYGTKVIQGKKYYDLGQNNYVKATNVSGVKHKLRRNSYVYSKAAKKLQRKALKKGQKVRTYGAAVKIQQKLYYIVGKNQYVKMSNF